MRTQNRALDELRKISLEVGANKYAEGSCLAAFGDTKVMCTATVEERVPLWLKNSGKGWITAEYGMLPRSTASRMDRESVKGGQCGRTHEIQRLIGRCLRASVNLDLLQDICIKVDCDVVQADGGTRTAAVTGGFVALYLALQRLEKVGIIRQIPLITTVAAVSCGFYQGKPILDLDYMEDSEAQTDANFCITGDEKIIEIQGTAEREPFSRKDLDLLLDLAFKGTAELAALQRKTLGI